MQSSTTEFESLHLEPNLVLILNQMNISTPTLIQKEAIPQVIAGRDVIAQSQTGTGKTLAYLLPLLQKIDAGLKQLQVMVVVPTRELGMQIMQVIDWFTPTLGVVAQSLIGGVSLQRQMDKLRLHPQIVVGTPGRIQELIKLKKLSMHYVQSIVVDEVDQVFDLGSKNEVEYLLKSTLRDRQVLFFSATITDNIQAAAELWMKEPVIIQIEPVHRIAESLEHLYFVCEKRDKIDTLRRVVRHYNPRSAIIFINETEDIAEVVEKLRYVGLSIEALYGEADKLDRAKVMSGFRAGRFQLLLATDVAARGLDLSEVSHVFNLELPVDADHYVHRAGRTGRMGRGGTVISIVEPKQQFIIAKYARTLGVVFTSKAMSGGKAIEADSVKPKASQKQSLTKDHMEGHREGHMEGHTKSPAMGRREGHTKSQAMGHMEGHTKSPPMDRREGHMEGRMDNRRGNKGAPHNQAQVDTLNKKPASTQTSANPRKQMKHDRELNRKNKGAPKWLKGKMNDDKSYIP